MHFTRIALNGFELFNFIRLKCGCKLASDDPKLLFVYRRITINWLISFQFAHSSFYFCHICTRLLVFWIWSSIMGAWDPQTLRDPDVPHFLLPKSCISSCSMRVCLHMLSYQCSALKLSGSRQERDIHHFMASDEPYTFQHMWSFASAYSCAYSNR